MEYAGRPLEDRLAEVEDDHRRGILAKLEKDTGLVHDPNTGRPLPVEPEDLPIEVDGAMEFWVRLDDSLVGARAENGHLVPSEMYAGIERAGIRSRDHQDVAARLLRFLCVGRIEAELEEIEPEKKDKHG